MVEELTKFVPLTIPVTYPDEEGRAKTIRYVNMDDLPEELRQQCDEYIQDVAE